ncbi:ABC transporter ATP-binding protein [Phaeobacter gallaeciensis]|uniref:ABC transporter ATP-binding protein n=1 Tax=Phaeobacter gallaeciensis TaxID=60890 RepID=UPI00237FA3BE|nr:ABC transporter ATP-binding protein [Phaeobacter gallaeciensis]MDE4097304.1 ABC transporter ATP-binding protein [Phaeobacter gallaeciensis]MDE4106182.1 ABC transporter ATP-binding protein [Phaeobacter gallaeciensis]MDE4110568.1 ABC transporter ATP-binding protein [Phaeobacter gallaeciensis]MDE4115039.1 ABC transporter ATP-binding protein [Phaeobacter gallaeciensis]MDE4119508.1 ABC transporter ATP-binding protein [Phaeobacter gallaeciensis]
MAGGIQVNSIGKAYAGKPAVDGVSCDIAQHEFFVIVGQSGCGKSTLLRLIAGLETPDQGEIRLHGDLVAGDGTMVPPEQRGTGFVFQSYALWPHMTVRGNVAFPLEAAGMSRKQAARLAEPHLETVSMQALADRKPEALSGGQRQRVALARCLAGGANTVLMDEPLANLDPHLRGTMEKELLRFHRSSGATTIYITHDQREAMALADRMAVMQDGRFLQIGTPQEIYDRPACPEVARFIGQGAVVPVTYQNGSAELAGYRFPAAALPGHPNGPAQALLRPEGIRILPDAGKDGLQGTVRSILYRGGIWDAEVEIAGGALLSLTHGTALHIGQPLSLAVDQAWVLPKMQTRGELDETA